MARVWGEKSIRHSQTNTYPRGTTFGSVCIFLLRETSQHSGLRPAQARWGEETPSVEDMNLQRERWLWPKKMIRKRARKTETCRKKSENAAGKATKHTLVLLVHVLPWTWPWRNFLSNVWGLRRSPMKTLICSPETNHRNHWKILSSWVPPKVSNMASIWHEPNWT